MKEWEEVLSRMANRLNKTWNCRKCDYTHHHKGYLMNHIEAHHAPPKFPGYRCVKFCVRVETRMNFLVHVTKCHTSNDVELKESNSAEKPQPFSNNPSNKSSKFKTQSLAANKNNKSLLPDSLAETDKIFLSTRISDYENYVTTKIASRTETKETFRCKFCKHNFNQRPDWDEHMSRVHSQNFAGSEEKLLKCGLCGYRCARNYDLKLHRSQLHERLPVKFSHSQVPVASFFLPPVKIKTSKHPAPRICQKCGAGFLDEESYAKHMTDVEGVDISKVGNSFRCEFCSYSFK